MSFVSIWHTVASTFMYLQVQIEASLCGADLKVTGSQPMLTAASTMWRTEAQNIDSKQHSSYVGQITDVALGLGFNVIHEDTSSEYAVDIALPIWKVAIEVDGPSHRSRNTGQALGPTAMKQRHIHAAGWQLLTITHQDWDQLQSRQEKQRFLQSGVRSIVISQELPQAL